MEDPVFCPEKLDAKDAILKKGGTQRNHNKTAWSLILLK